MDVTNLVDIAKVELLRPKVIWKESVIYRAGASFQGASCTSPVMPFSEDDPDSLPPRLGLVIAPGGSDAENP